MIRSAQILSVQQVDHAFLGRCGNQRPLVEQEDDGTVGAEIVVFRVQFGLIGGRVGVEQPQVVRQAEIVFPNLPLAGSYGPSAVCASTPVGLLTIPPLPHGPAALPGLV